MDRADLERGDELARRLIGEYWEALVTGDAWFFHTSRTRYVPPDDWATEADWVAAAELCLESGHNQSSAFDVLLAAGRGELLERAARWIEGLYLGDYFEEPLHLVALFPADHPVRVEHLGESPEHYEEDEFWGWNAAARRALLRAGDTKLAAYMGGRIAEVLGAEPADLERVADYALPRMAQLGPLCARFVPEPLVRRAHHLTYELLALDRRAVLEERHLREEWERSHFVRWEVAFLAARLGWRDVFASLAPQEWYWRDLFECYDELENVNLLSWSRFHAGERLFARALYLMDTLGLHPLDGAIAWKRLRARPVAPGAGANR
jgi:hypothetical protein